MKISELLDELQKTARVYGSTLQGKIPSPEATKWHGKQEAARAAVDAEIKALQDAKDDMLDLLKDQKKEIDRLHGIEDRIAELEREMSKGELISRVAKAWAEMDGKSEEFEAGRQALLREAEDESGHYEGYHSDTISLLRKAGLINDDPPTVDFGLEER